MENSLKPKCLARTYIYKASHTSLNLVYDYMRALQLLILCLKFMYIVWLFLYVLVKYFDMRDVFDGFAPYIIAGMID